MMSIYLSRSFRRFNSSFFLLFLLRPVFRLFFTYFYYFFLCYFFGPYTDLNSISDITQSSGNSNSINPAEHFQEPNNLHDEHPIGENEAPNHNGIPVDVVDLFRILNQDMELELFARIRLLENRMIEGLPPQLNLGEYETLVL